LTPLRPFPRALALGLLVALPCFGILLPAVRGQQQQPTAAAATPAAGLVTIESDRQLADNRTGVVTAIGRVRIVYPPRQLVATARQAQYYSREGRLVLSGDVELQEANGQSLKAERVVYRLDSERLEVLPAQGRQVITRLRLQAPASQPAPLPLP